MGNQTPNRRANSKVKPFVTAGAAPMPIGKLAANTGVSPDGLRFYETLGLIEAYRGANGYRWYPAATVDFVNYVKTAQRLGFTLAEISAHAHELRSSRDRDAGGALFLRRRIEAIEHRIAELGALRDELRQRARGPCPLQATAPQ